MEYQYSICRVTEKTSYIADDVPGGLGCLNRNCIPGEEVTFLDGFLEALSVQFLNNKMEKKMGDHYFVKDSTLRGYMDFN